MAKTKKNVQNALRQQLYQKEKNGVKNVRIIMKK